MKNKQIKTAQTNSNVSKTTNLSVKAINSKQQVKGKGGHMVQIHVFLS